MNVRSDMVTCFVVRSAESGIGEFLQMRRASADYMGGTWQIVRGRIEDGETAVAAALRELREETGLAPIELYRLGTIESFYIEGDDTLWHSVAFCAFVACGAEVVVNEEHDAFRWIGRSEIEAQTMWPSEKFLLSHVLRDILPESMAKPYLRIQINRTGTS